MQDILCFFLLFKSYFFAFNFSLIDCQVFSQVLQLVNTGLGGKKLLRKQWEWALCDGVVVDDDDDDDDDDVSDGDDCDDFDDADDDGT